MIYTSDDLRAVAGMWRTLLLAVPEGTVLTDRPDVVLRPDEDTWARRTLPDGSEMPYLDWHPLLGVRRSRLSLSDGWAFYGGGL